jgi:hypothetical protein
MDLDYSDNAGTSWSVLDSNQVNDGAYLWDISGLPNGSDYLVRIIATDTTGLSDSDNSDATFAILHIGAITGTVSEAKGVIEGAIVIAVGPETRSDTTDAGGHYIIEGLSVGSYDVTAYAPGYHSSTQQGMAVTSADTTVVDFALATRTYWTILDDFSDVQGKDDWFYGYTHDGGPYALMTEYGVHPADTLWSVDWLAPAPQYFTCMSRDFMHGNGLITSAGRTPADQEAVLRWVSPIHAVVQCSGHVEKSTINLASNGVDWFIRHGETAVFSGYLAGDDSVGFDYTELVLVTVGDSIDFVLNSHESEDHSDGTCYSVMIEVASVEPSVTITYPNGGETLTDSVTIIWTATDLNPGETSLLIVDLDYSADAGSNWAAIDSNQTNDGSHLWDISGLPDGSDYLVRITVTDTTSLSDSDTSDAVFTISNTGAIAGTVGQAKAPIEGAVVTAVGPETKSDTTDAGGGYIIEMLQPGLYDVTATADGYDPEIENGISVAAAETTTVDFLLTQIAVTPPEAVQDLTVTLAGLDLMFAWSAVTVDTSGTSIVVDLYRVYRDTVIDFFPGPVPLDSTVDLEYLDTTGVVGNTTVHYYYVITAVAGGKESEPSNQVGEFDRTLPSGP